MAPTLRLKTYSKRDKLRNTKRASSNIEKENVNCRKKSHRNKKRSTLTISPIISVDIVSNHYTDTSDNSSIIVPWAETTFDKLRRGTIRNLHPPPQLSNATKSAFSDTSSAENSVRTVTESPKIVVYSPKLKRPKRVYQAKRKVLTTIDQSPTRNEKSTLPEDNVLLHELVVEPYSEHSLKANHTAELQLNSLSMLNSPFKLDTHFAHSFTASTPVAKSMLNRKHGAASDQLELECKVLLTPLPVVDQSSRLSVHVVSLTPTKQRSNTSSIILINDAQASRPHLRRAYVRLNRIDDSLPGISETAAGEADDADDDASSSLSEASHLLVNKLCAMSHACNETLQKTNDKTKEFYGFTKAPSDSDRSTNPIQCLTPTLASPSVRSRSHINENGCSRVPLVVLDRLDLETLSARSSSYSVIDTTSSLLGETGVGGRRSSFKLRIKFKNKNRVLGNRSKSVNSFKSSRSRSSSRKSIRRILSDFNLNASATDDTISRRDVEARADSSQLEFQSIKKSLINKRRGGCDKRCLMSTTPPTSLQLETIDLTTKTPDDSVGCEFLNNSSSSSVICLDDDALQQTPTRTSSTGRRSRRSKRLLRNVLIRHITESPHARRLTEGALPPPTSRTPGASGVDAATLLPDKIYLKPGKQWQRSLSLLRQTYAARANESVGSARKGRRWRRTLFEITNDNKGACLNTFAPNTTATTTDVVELKAEQTATPNLIENIIGKRLSVRILPTIAQQSKLSDQQYQQENSHIGDDNNGGVEKRSDLEIYACTAQTLQYEGYVSSHVDPNQIEGLDGIFNNLSLGINNNKTTTHQSSSTAAHALRDTCGCVVPLALPSITAQEIVLKRCNQTEPLEFEHCYPDSLLQKCHKIGEGVYGEVFLLKTAAGRATVLKIIPIEGVVLVNGEHQKKYDEIISEIIIAQELSALRGGAGSGTAADDVVGDRNDDDNALMNQTQCYTHVQGVHCVRGRYPERLIELWELYDEDRGSENDHPGMFDDDQLYIVFELEHGGRDLESFEFTSAEQAYAIFIQTAFALAVAEEALKFEHRDLHWGNLLIQYTDEKHMKFVLNGDVFMIPTCGVKATIIDFTMSRITTYEDEVCIYINLADDPDLFKSDGDYQFEIYKLMQRKNNNVWEHFEPFTNILWLHYILMKMIDGAHYKRVKTMKHLRHITMMEAIAQTMLTTYVSANHFVRTCFKDDDDLLLYSLKL